MKNIYTSIDIGSDTVKVVTCELFKNKLTLLAASSARSRGIKRGLITDVEMATVSVKEALNKVEQMLGIKITKVIASVPSYFADFFVVKGITEITSEDHVIIGDDVSVCLENAIASKDIGNKEMITILPIDFRVDGKEAITDPKGLVGNVLETRAIMVTTPKKNVYSVLSLLESIGIEVVDISLTSIGDAFAFKNKDMDNKVGAIINVGSELTSVSLYNKGIIVKNSIIQLGGINIDNDIAYIYKIDYEKAKQLKEKFALAHKMYAQASATAETTTTMGEAIKINQYEISEIAMIRLEEILSLAKKEISILTNRPVEYIIVTGGTSNMANFDYIADDIFGKISSVGNVKLIGARNNKYASAIGNIAYFISKLKLKGKEYSMFSKNDVEELSSNRKGVINISNETMLGKVFGYFFNE